MQKIFKNPKTSKIEKINEKGKKLNPHASVSTLSLLFWGQMTWKKTQLVES